MILGRSPHHGGATDIDLLDNVLPLRPGGHRLDKGIEVHHDQLDGRDAQFVERGHMLGFAQIGKNSAVNRRVQGLHSPVEGLRKARDLADINGLNTGRAQGARG